ncbi:hypothetical protein [Hymenobacter jeollabukensis]|uniref:Outer membrane protein beta-barrel domain-containing protein n=1 Tax=Hymenobacter jeollabukensis TaxID=2025313 RepID=A0A5R8WWG2_9BACT|nr:hypothetical protein [Hymenobacter jeollabukensis]TLM96485.1 hypothetical protein FDY95_00350 [Hymenobacter jeollabukensis]
MKRLLLAAALGFAGLFATTDALAQRTDTTYVKPQLPTGPPAVPPPAPAQPTRPVYTQPQQPAQPQPTQPVRPSGGIDDDGRSAQPLPGSRPAQPAAPATPQRPGGGIDDDGRPAQTLPQNGTVPGATLQSEYQPGKLFLYGSLLRFGLSSNFFSGVDFSAGFAPALGYRITDKLSVAAGPVFVYHSVDFGPDATSLGLPAGGYKFKDVGVRGLAQFTVYKNIFLQAEYESTRSQDCVVNELVPRRQYESFRTQGNTQALLVGVGYRQRLGDRFAVDGALLYNTNSDLNYYGILIQRLSLVYNLGGK